MSIVKFVGKQITIQGRQMKINRYYKYFNENKYFFRKTFKKKYIYYIAKSQTLVVVT